MLGELFDPKKGVTISERIRPHWSQDGAVVFVTFRSRDSIPQEVLVRWNLEKNLWLEQRGLLNGKHWHDALPLLDDEQRKAFLRHFDRTREDFLDTCYGKCVLEQLELASIVHDALLFFDGDRYCMGDFVVMPNHVHLLAAFPSAERMQSQFDSWLHYTAFRINKAIGAEGHFWQQEPFDHLVRSLEQYEYLRKYIADNPTKAKLPAGKYLYRRDSR
jgi:type I restriction enzyme R subunit